MFLLLFGLYPCNFGKNSSSLVLEKLCDLIYILDSNSDFLSFKIPGEYILKLFSI